MPQDFPLHNDALTDEHALTTMVSMLALIGGRTP
jgi:hypothetical protein